MGVPYSLRYVCFETVTLLTLCHLFKAWAGCCTKCMLLITLLNQSDMLKSGVSETSTFILTAKKQKVIILSKISVWMKAVWYFKFLTSQVLVKLFKTTFTSICTLLYIRIQLGYNLNIVLLYKSRTEFDGFVSLEINRTCQLYKGAHKLIANL